MKASIALKIFRDYQKANLKPGTVGGYTYLLDNFEALFGEKDLKSITSEDAYHFLEIITENSSKSSKRHRYSQLKAFFNFVISNYLPDLKNPLDSPFMRKMFPLPKPKQREVISKAMIDEVIFNSQGLRDRLILELQSRCGARIGEVLKTRVKDIDGRKIIVQNPKSGKEKETIFMPEQVAERLKVYIQEKGLREQDRVFDLSYATARKMINKLGEKVGIKLKPHDLRRHSATFASRNGVPLELISKVLLRHQDLKTTQLYLGRVSDSEAIRWMDILHGK
ncbi:MAG: tyrosine-type recombinase/integrase [Anaerolineales bacterium]|nr:tyrosine-type recombinase/integrase [Anaerolineales bacterium]